jgi:hypothetical protein
MIYIFEVLNTTACGTERYGSCINMFTEPTDTPTPQAYGKCTLRVANLLIFFRKTIDKSFARFLSEGEKGKNNYKKVFLEMKLQTTMAHRPNTTMLLN